MAEGFDPDAYLKSKAAPAAAFDPDAYLKSKAPKEETVSQHEKPFLQTALEYASPAGAMIHYNAAAARLAGLPKVAEAMEDYGSAIPRGGTMGALDLVPGEKEFQEDVSKRSPIASTLGNLSGAAALPLPVPKGLKGGGVLPALGRIGVRGGEIGAVEAGKEAGREALGPGQMQPGEIAKAGARGFGAGAAGSAIGEGLSTGANALGAKPMAALGQRADELQAAAGEEPLAAGMVGPPKPKLMPEAASNIARGEMSDAANASLKKGAGNLLAGGAKEAIANFVGGGRGMALMGLAGGGQQILSGAKQLAMGILKRPGIVQQIAKVEPFGPAIANAAAQGANQLTATLFALGRKDPQSLDRVAKHLQQPNDKESPAGYKPGFQ